ncbi:hypothetical protein [Bradyrhizobium yuanmingense]|uniref:hypothetical protein n=1 Tax=Bradyrhizobium yuanmingense TaxID=108015 RepID=UPI0023B95BE8|nr:hypothetical protein [Bradyrhizobium yuanmingense]MDF0518657.1 hypothetical protein [Bradyrhizobium yuanmingense]MDF0579795.1 hypothetical protein [Bradyrhizobium yuanmingense]
MNTPRIESRRASTSVRSPIIVNQLGAEVRAVLADHWSRPLIIDHPADRAPWEIAPEADVLLTRPLAGWHGAPKEKPAGWPFGLRWIQTASRLADKTLVNLDAYAHGVALADVFDKNLEY